jgi:hypothetical protein
MIIWVGSQPRRVSFDLLFCALLIALQWLSTMNEGFADCTKLSFLPFASRSDEPIPEINSIRKKLGQLTLSALNHFHPKEGTPKSQRAPRKPVGLKHQAQE